MQFYLKAGRLILQHVKGDFSLSSPNFNFAELSTLFMPTDKLVHLVQKIFPGNHSQIVTSLFQNLTVVAPAHVNCQELRV